MYQRQRRRVRGPDVEWSQGKEVIMKREGWFLFPPKHQPLLAKIKHAMRAASLKVVFIWGSGKGKPNSSHHCQEQPGQVLWEVSHSFANASQAWFKKPWPSLLLQFLEQGMLFVVNSAKFCNEKKMQIGPENSSSLWFKGEMKGATFVIETQSALDHLGTAHPGCKLAVPW